MRTCTYICASIRVFKSEFDIGRIVGSHLTRNQTLRGMDQEDVNLSSGICNHRDFHKSCLKAYGLPTPQISKKK